MACFDKLGMTRETMGFFERPDPRLAQSADPSPLAAVSRALGRQAAALALSLVALAGVYATNIALGLHEAATTRGSLAVAGLYAPVTIVRDARDIPHVRAGNEHDLYFAQGFVEGSDRLFQLDLTRRYAYGRLAEVLGPKALPYDKTQRAVDIDGIAQRQLRAMAPRDRAAVVAFSEGVNAAEATQPLPVEFRMLLYRPAPWTPKDSLAVSVVASLELADSWRDIFARDAVWREHGARGYDVAFPLSDARYDVTVRGRRDFDALARNSLMTQRRTIGSNAWAAGAARSTDGHALIANDPHLDLTIPGIWYLVDLHSPQVHAAGATVPGMPGIVLGHNERVAWASTNAAMATTSVFEAARLRGGAWVTERFGVRFGRDVRLRYYRTPVEFSVPNENQQGAMALVRWPVYAQRRSTIATALALDRARNVGDALAIIARYRGSPQNFVVADRNGLVAYHVAGLVPDDPAWGRWVHPAHDLRDVYAPMPFARLPSAGPSRRGVFVTANNKPYGAGYPFRLSAQFDPPYRAYRIAQLLRERRRYDPAYFSQMQMDTLSPVDLEIAHGVVRFARADGTDKDGRQALIEALARWDGRFSPGSTAAALEHALRETVFEEGPGFDARLDELRSGPDERATDLGQDLSGMLSLFAFHRVPQWGNAGGERIEHLLAPMHFGFLDGRWLPGEGDEYTIHLQEPGIAQGFRAVWDAGDWDRGGISIPSGESGEPGSGHYTDLTRDWVSGILRPLPFSQASVARSGVALLLLRPRR